jgi:hypothetical protein
MTQPDSAAPPYEVFSYSRAKLEELLTTYAEFASKISSKLHLDYFEGYFGDIGAKSIVVEHQYVDRDFLEDYSAYYVRCFQDYSRYCRRLHFFRCELTAESFSKTLGGNANGVSVEELHREYLGFVVVKPLPTTVVDEALVGSKQEISTNRNSTLIQEQYRSLCL